MGVANVLELVPRHESEDPVTFITPTIRPPTRFGSTGSGLKLGRRAWLGEAHIARYEYYDYLQIPSFTLYARDKTDARKNSAKILSDSSVIVGKW